MAIFKSGLFPCFKLKRGPDHQDEQCSAHRILQLRGIFNCRSIQRKYVLLLRRVKSAAMVSSLPMQGAGNIGISSHRSTHTDQVCETVIFPLGAPLLSPNFGSVQQVTSFFSHFPRPAIRSHCGSHKSLFSRPNGLGGAEQVAKPDHICASLRACRLQSFTIIFASGSLFRYHCPVLGQPASGMPSLVANVAG